MIKRVKDAYYRHVKRQENIQKSLDEVNWAHCFHDSIRGYKELEGLSLNIGRWAGGYPFFYCLFRILSSNKTSNVLEMGLGESSKFISTYLKNYSTDKKHFILEHNENWTQHYFKLNELSNNSEVIQSELKIDGTEPSAYSSSKTIDYNHIDLFVIDGPIGTKMNSRTDILEIARDFKSNKNFVILFDDTNRQGEKNTLDNLYSILKNNEIDFYTRDFNGKKRCSLIVSADNRFLTSI